MLEVGVSAVFVFDGPLKPRMKRKRHVSGGRNMPHEAAFCRMIEAFGFQWRKAPGEAEAELAYLSKTFQLDFVISDDVDTLAFGARRLLRNPSKNLSGSEAQNKHDVAKKAAKCKKKGKDASDSSEADIPAVQKTAAYKDADVKDWHTAWDAAAIEREIGLTANGMILIALMSGGDYIRKRLKVIDALLANIIT